MKIIRFLSPIIAFIVAASTSCSGNKTQQNNRATSNNKTSDIITPLDVKNHNQEGEEKTVFGVTIDRAMNSIVIRSEAGDTLSFEYPETSNPGIMARTHVGDTVTIKYVHIHDNDSLTAVLRGKRP